MVLHVMNVAERKEHNCCVVLSKMLLAPDEDEDEADSLDELGQTAGFHSPHKLSWGPSALPCRLEDGEGQSPASHRFSSTLHKCRGEDPSA